MNFKKLLYLSLFLVSVTNCTNAEQVEVGKCSLTVENELAYYENKLYSGTCNTLYADSLLWRTTTYKRGLVVKQLGYYLPESQLEYIGNKKNGHIHGDFEGFHKNGKIKMQGNFIKGYRDGNWSYYNEEGEIDSTITYKKGVEIN